jgi:hypothetical protein
MATRGLIDNENEDDNDLSVPERIAIGAIDRLEAYATLRRCASRWVRGRRFPQGLELALDPTESNVK